MKNTVKRLLCLLLASCMCAGLALGAAADEGTPAAPTGIMINDPNTSELYVGQSLNLSYIVLPSDATGTVIWSSSNTAAAPVDQSGNVQALMASADPVVITATVDGYMGLDGQPIKDELSLTVKDDWIEHYNITGGSITGGNGTYSLSLTGTASFTLTAEAVYYSGAKKPGAIWSLDEEGMGVLSFTSAGEFTVVRPGNALITAAFPEDTTQKATVTVHVEPAPLTGLTISREGTNVTGGTVELNAGATLALTAAKVPANTFNNDAVTWGSSAPDVATVDANGNVRAVKSGSAAITATCGEKTASVTVSVKAPSKDVSASVTRGKNLTFTKICSDLSAIFSGTRGTSPTGLKLTGLGSTGIGVVYDGNGANISTSTFYSLSDAGRFYFVPASIGSSTLSYTLTDGTNTLSGNIIIKVEGSKTKDINIKLKDDSPYTFSSNATTDKVTGYETIRKAIYDASGKNYSYIVFDTDSVSSSSSRVGTLYPASDKNYNLSKYGSYTYGSANSQQSQVSKLYFEPKKEGTYRIAYTAFDGSSELCSGYLVIDVGVTNDGTVTVTLDNSGRYTFSEKTKKDKTSAATAIYDTVGKNYSYIRFGSIVSGNNVGTLYADSDKTDIKNNTKYYRSSSSGYTVSDLYFVPERSGTYVRSFTAYDSSDNELLLGTLKIVVPGENDGEMDIYFNTTTGSTVSLGESVFESWYRQQKGSNYKLAYVTFDDASRSFGSFKHGSASFTPGNDVKYFTEGFTGSTGSSPKYLDNVKFTAPNSTGCISVDFTCYGGTSASASGTKASGTFFIFVTNSGVKSITRDVKYGSAVTLSENEFSSVHRSAMSLSPTSSARYYIELLEIPSKGTLYYNYTSASKPGTKLTGSNYDDYEFYVNSASSYDSVSDLTYVPANSSSGSVNVRYLARSTGGDPMYVGTVSFSYGAQQGASFSCGADGYTFKTSDFYSSSDADPVAYVTFTQPDSGELMLGYTNGRGVPLDSSVRLYTSKAANGSYPLTSLSYIPKAGFSGSVPVYYTAVTEAGKAQSGVLTIEVASRKGSAHFKDVQSTGSGAWASDAIDYAYKWGLVNGTGEGTFSPDNTMTRAMLVTILYRSAGSPKASGSCPFTDVPAGSYYYDAVIWAAKGGIVTGTSETTFSPDRDVNREQVATFLHRYAKYNGENAPVTGTLNGYSDKAFVSQYAVEPMSWAVQRGYITSTSGAELLLSPGGSATRAQVAVMLHRFLTY